MKKYLRRASMVVAPTAVTRLGRLAALDDLDDVSATGLYVRLEKEITDLRKQVDELRRDNRRVVELYDLVFERLQRENPLSEKESR